MKADSRQRQKSERERILVIEDDHSLREGLAMNLRLQGYEALTAADGREGMQLAFESDPDLIVLDLMMPRFSGLEVLNELRNRRKDVPVLILSARGATADKVQGLNLGADDYITKPFNLSELLARIQALLRRRQAEADSVPPLKLGELFIDRTTRKARLGGRDLELSAREFDLLCLLAESPGRVFTRETILKRLWGWDYNGTERTIDNFIAGLRRKLGRRKYIHTVPRVGYKLEAG